MAKLYNTLHNKIVRLNMQFEVKLLKNYIKALIVEESSLRKLRIFDFDDTLATTDCMVRVKHADGKEQALTPGEFAVYDEQPGDVFDYSDFRDLINPKAISWTIKILNNVYSKYGPSGLVILTARSSAEPIRKFLDDAGFPGILIVALGDASPSAKAKWIEQRIKVDNYNFIEFFDDSPKYIAAVKELQNKYPDVEIITRQIVHRFKGGR